MENVLIDKKAGVSIAVVLLVIATIILSSFAIFSFITKQKNVEEVIYGNSLQGVYAKESLLNFYIQEIGDRSAKGVSSEANFISNFKIELERYKDADENYLLSELGQLNNQLNEESIKLENNQISANFDIEIKDKTLRDGKEILSASYKYAKTFKFLT